MSAVDIVAFGAISALGRGEAAIDPGRLGAPAESRIAHDEALARAGLAKPFVARASVEPGPDRARELLSAAALDLARELERVLPGWRSQRIGLCVGSSGGGVESLCKAVAAFDRRDAIARELALSAPYFGPLTALDELGVVFEPRVQVLGACASSTFALGLGCRFIELGLADLVIAGGYDEIGPFIASGFECLGATSARPLPFRAARDGLALGEGAALVALAAPRVGRARRGRILGFGAASDAVHVTAPDRAGTGLGRAASRALADAALDARAVSLISAHGTGTSYNDSAEAAAITRLLGEHASQVVVHPFKATIGHTLGAAGVLETLSIVSALERGLAPAAYGSGPAEPALGAALLERAQASFATHALKLSSAFGGANAALVLGAPAVVPSVVPRGRRPVCVLARGPVVREANAKGLAGSVRTDALKLARMDELSLLVVGAAARVAPLPEDAGVIVGTAGATLDLDAEFERRRVARGPEPRRFPATSPNLCAGECTIAFGLHGPSFSVGADPAAAIEALLVAHDLVASGVVDTMLVVAAETAGELEQVLWTAAGWPALVRGAAAVLVGVGTGRMLHRERLASVHRRARAAGGALDGATGAGALLAAVAAAAIGGALPP